MGLSYWRVEGRFPEVISSRHYPRNLSDTPVSKVVRDTKISSTRSDPGLFLLEEANLLSQQKFLIVSRNLRMIILSLH